MAKPFGVLLPKSLRKISAALFPPLFSLLPCVFVCQAVGDLLDIEWWPGNDYASPSVVASVFVSL